MKAMDISNPTSVGRFLYENDITPTQQRVEIAQLLFKKQQHICAEQVISSLNKKAKPVSKATVYNTLGLFAKKGLLREVIIDPSKVFYDTNTQQHHHFYNTSTHKLSDIKGTDISIAKLPNLPKGTNLQHVDVIIKVSNK